MIKRKRIKPLEEEVLVCGGLCLGGGDEWCGGGDGGDESCGGGDGGDEWCGGGDGGDEWCGGGFF
ncbi:hypothetical protein Tco_1087092, partial [Tanacetum coccineum]